ncbi:hypothetical protein EYC84_008706 [Monilinia fructicola]|uniref:Uncharacterized protein n=1 Tax=Monilinia fructicola TaxID=38448 RepID=A0A5M9JE55_MONFR|nr:hypothetical protein EYC84_008706 [Monilinia fructicola]
MSGYSHQRRQSPTRPARRSEYSDTIDVDEYHGSEAGQYPDEIDDEGSEDGGSASIDPSPATAPHDQPAYAYAENRDRDEYRRGRVYVNVTPSSVPTRNQRVHPGVSIRPRQIRYSHVRADETQFSFRRRSLPPRRDLSPLPPLPRENTFSSTLTTAASQFISPTLTNFERQI